MQDLAHTVQREVEHIVILHILAHMGHDQCIAVVLPCFGGIALRVSFRLRFHRSQLCKAAARLDLTDGLADGSFHFVRVHRLEQIIAGPQMHGLVGVLEQTVGRNKDHLALRALFQHGAGCIQTVHTGHLNVHQDQVCAPQHRRIRCLAAVLGSLDGHFVLKAAGHDVRQRFPFQCFIIRDQQTNHSSNSSSFSTNGRYSTTAVPRPGWDRITKRLFRSSRRRRAATL